ncbi:MAG: DUF2141 domain-containing protein [Bacteroidota bacterium]|nr:DUF2141 domain-containing protein [Bacteroidota bacterium]
MKTPQNVFLILFIVASIFINSTSILAQNIELTIKGIRSSKGQLLLGVFKDNESFNKEKPYKGFKFSKKDIANGTLTVKFNLEPGIYGMSLLDDENSNGKMDYNFIGIPQEGFGFSDYYHKALSKPDFEMFKIRVDGEYQKVEIIIRYIL